MTIWTIYLDNYTWLCHLNRIESFKNSLLYDIKVNLYPICYFHQYKFDEETILHKKIVMHKTTTNMCMSFLTHTSLTSDLPFSLHEERSPSPIFWFNSVMTTIFNNIVNLLKSLCFVIYRSVQTLVFINYRTLFRIKNCIAYEYFITDIFSKFVFFSWNVSIFFKKSFFGTCYEIE